MDLAVFQLFTLFSYATRVLGCSSDDFKINLIEEMNFTDTYIQIKNSVKNERPDRLFLNLSIFWTKTFSISF